MDRKRLALSLLSLWFAAVAVVFFLFGNRNAAVFASLFVAGYGGICYHYRLGIRSALTGIPGHRALSFFVVAFAVTAAEEIFCFLTGNRIALPVLWADILFCGLVWSGWFGTWYFFLSKKYRFREAEALLVAGMAGILYEGFGPVVANPANLLPIVVIAPFLVLVYSAIFLVPMQLISFTGEKESVWKYPVSIGLPFLVSLPITLVLFVLFSATGVTAQ